MDLTPETYFQRALDSLEASPIPLQGKASKVLFFMLERDSGCDLLVELNRFEIRYGWHTSRHRYALDVAPDVLSFFVARLQNQFATPAFRRGLLHAEALPPTDDGFPSWTFAPRHVWLTHSPTAVRLFVRRAASLSPPPPELPPSIVPAPTYREFPSGLVCTSCGKSSVRFREALQGRLVCPLCACSFRAHDV